EVLRLARRPVRHPQQQYRPAAAPRQPHPRRLDLPRLVAQRLPGQAEDVPGLPGEPRAVPHQVIGPAGLPAGRGPAAEAAEGLGYLADIAQPPLVPASEVTGLIPVALVEGEPVEGEAVGQGPVELPQGDLPLGPVADILGDAGPAAAVAVLVPGLRQEQVGVAEGLVAALGDPGVDGDDAVLHLADL